MAEVDVTRPAQSRHSQAEFRRAQTVQKCTQHERFPDQSCEPALYPVVSNSWIFDPLTGDKAVRYYCTIYNRTYSLNTTTDQSDSGTTCPLASIVVSGKNLREAAARAYVHCVGKQRAEQMLSGSNPRRRVIAQETNPRAIAASLRKTAGRVGEGYELDNFVHGWFIKVEPMPASRLPRPSRFRLPLPHLIRMLASPSLN